MEARIGSTNNSGGAIGTPGRSSFGGRSVGILAAEYHMFVYPPARYREILALCKRCSRENQSYVIPTEVEGPLNCGTRHSSGRGPSTSLRMTIFGCLVGSDTTITHADASVGSGCHKKRRAPSFPKAPFIFDGDKPNSVVHRSERDDHLS